MQGLGRVVAFEPFEPTKRLLEKSVWMNGFSSSVEVHQAAVSSHSGHQKLFLGATSGHHSLFPLSLPPGMGKPPVEVKVVTLDEMMAPKTVVTLIKIDVEGAELEVLEGARSLLEQNEGVALIVEFAPSHLRRSGHTIRDWLSCFEGLGMTYRVINKETGALETWPEGRLERVESVNLLFARPGVTVWDKARV